MRKGGETEKNPSFGTRKRDVFRRNVLAAFFVEGRSAVVAEKETKPS